jgi:hypothetical protein
MIARLRYLFKAIKSTWRPNQCPCFNCAPETEEIRELFRAVLEGIRERTDNFVQQLVQTRLAEIRHLRPAHIPSSVPPSVEEWRLSLGLPNEPKSGEPLEVPYSRSAPVSATLLGLSTVSPLAESDRSSLSLQSVQKSSKCDPSTSLPLRE